MPNFNLHKPIYIHDHTDTHILPHTQTQTRKWPSQVALEGLLLPLLLQQHLCQPELHLRQELPLVDPQPPTPDSLDSTRLPPSVRNKTQNTKHETPQRVFVRHMLSDCPATGPQQQQVFGGFGPFIPAVNANSNQGLAVTLNSYHLR